MALNVGNKGRLRSLSGDGVVIYGLAIQPRAIVPRRPRWQPRDPSPQAEVVSRGRRPPPWCGAT